MIVYCTVQVVNASKVARVLNALLSMRCRFSLLGSSQLSLSTTLLELPQLKLLNTPALQPREIL